jgi:hypothetical protein
MSIVSDSHLLSRPFGHGRKQGVSMRKAAEAADTCAEAEIAGEPTSVLDVLDPKTTYQMFPDRFGRWHVCRLDGGVFGIFSQRRAGAQFVWRKCHDAKRLIVTEGPSLDGKLI